MNQKEKLKNYLAEYFACSPQNIILTWKGRVGLYGMLKCLGVGPGDEVIMPAFTCVVVPNAVLYLGAKPVYVDIDRHTYNIDVGKLENKVSERTKVILAQNTYGQAPDIDKIRNIAERARIHVLEDCTHGFGGSYKGVLNGKNVDAAFFSTQWNKMFSSGLGGISLVSDPELSAYMNQFESELESPGLLEQTVLSLQLIVRGVIGYSALYWRALRVFRWLARNNLMLGSSSGSEIAEPTMPPGYLTGFSEIQARRCLSELAKIQQNIQHRVNVASRYDKVLSDLGVDPPRVADFATHTYTKYPLLVSKRDYVLEQAEIAGLPFHDWFISPLHPVKDDLQKWGLDISEFPVASSVAQHMINLPTDKAVGKKMLEKVESFLRAHSDQLINVDQIC